MNILFWNLNKNPITNHVVDCLIENNIDLALFSEYINIDFDEIESKTEYKHIENVGGCNKITMLALPKIKMLVQAEYSRFILYSFLFNNKQYNVAGIHLEDRRNDPDGVLRLSTIRDVTNSILEVEEKFYCDNTLVIGDFNANPFDKELLQVDAFNAVLFKEIISRRDIKCINNKSYKRFYNPTLNFLSESTKNYGSFYYNQSFNTPIWNSFDQIIVRKPLMDLIEEVCYLRKIGSKSLINSIKPNKKISDHLPLIVNRRRIK